ncbi:MAG: hypothetical protein WCH34_01265, partial [Bacteroidota bacterium]
VFKAALQMPLSRSVAQFRRHMPPRGGGVNPMQYLWSDGITSKNRTTLCARNYSVKITDDNGCKIGTEKIYLTEPPETNWKETGNGLTDPNVNFIGTTDAKDFILKTNGQEVLRLTSEGKVKIKSLINPNGHSLTSDLEGELHLVTCAEWNTCGNELGATLNGHEFFFGSTNNYDVIFKTNNNEVMRLGTNGKLGIGTSSPDEKLQVNGNIHSNNSIICGGSDFILGVNDGRGTGGTINTNRALVHGDGASNASDLLVINFGGDFEDGVNIQGPKTIFNGKVGIGTNTIPSEYQFVVKGNINCEEVKVIANVPPDYVFDKNYPLMDLKTLESYLNVNKHLPDVPSAAESKENGYKVAEMQELLLRKVEELTLYILELKKENEQLKEKMNILEKKY